MAHRDNYNPSSGNYRNSMGIVITTTIAIRKASVGMEAASAPEIVSFVDMNSAFFWIEYNRY